MEHKRSNSRILPAEWEPQDAVLLAWPHEGTDWAPCLPQAETACASLAAAIARFEPVMILAVDPDRVRRRLEGRVDSASVRLIPVPYNDTWTRDYGPLTVYRDGRPLLLDFEFTGWGGRYDAEDDNAVTRRLSAGGHFGDTACETVDFALEGGSIESDGRGTILTTTSCLLNPNRRDPSAGRADVEAVLRRTLGAERVLWLEHGSLEGDDTDAHIDILARFAPGDVLLHLHCPDPRDAHYLPLQQMEADLRAFCTPEGAPYRLLPLPWPAPRHDAEGCRLPAGYANFMVINGAVLVPTYDDPADADALEIIGRAFPGREMVGVDASTLILQHGALHCAAMQIPKGVCP